MLVRCKHTGHVYIYIHLYGFLNLFDRSVCCYPLAFVPKQNSRDTSTFNRSKFCLEAFWLKSTEASSGRSQFCNRKSFLTSNSITAGDIQQNITLELASTCRPGRWSGIFTAVTRSGAGPKALHSWATVQPPGSFLVGRAQEKSLVDTWKVMLGVSVISKEKRRPPRIVRIVQMRTNEPAVASSTAILFLLGRPQGSNNTCLTKGPIDLQRNLIHLVTLVTFC